MRTLRLALLPALILPTVFLVACTATTDDDDDTVLQPATIEFQDIFIPDRLIELPVLPGGTQVLNEVFIHNAGDRVLNIDEVSLNYQSDGNWELNPDTIPRAIQPHEFAIVEVLYTASETSDTFAALEVFSDDPDEAEKSVAFIGRQATGGPRARVSESLLDWGFQFRRVEVRKLITVTNTGDEPLRITDVVLEQSEFQIAFHMVCPGVATEDCDWETAQKPQLLQDEILPGSGALFEVAFVPENLQAVSATLKVQTSDPLRDEFSVILLGNGESALNCTAPTVAVTSPLEATFFHSWQNMDVTARVLDAEQPGSSLYVEMFLGDLLIEDEFPDENGFVHFSIDIDNHEPPLPSGLQPFTLRVTDGCPTFGFDTFVAAIDFPLPPDDLDGDGFSPSQGDCNDSDPEAFPQNVEVFDGVDNDCDSTVDEGTVVWDNDCDGYCAHDSICLGQETNLAGVTCQPLLPAGENTGDCNDSGFDLDQDGAPDGHPINPGAAELLNFLDDDCDGQTDENTTFYDDDGDGLTEAAGDCDDDNVDVFEGATEWCDDLDNDCDGPIDEECIDRTAPPRCVGGVLSNNFQIALGSRVPVEVLVVSQDPNLTYEWQSLVDNDPSLGAFADTALGPANIWDAPEENDDNRTNLDGEFVSIWVEVTDTLGQSDTCFGTLLVKSDVTIQYTPIAPQTSECSSAGAAPVGFGALLLGLLGLVRRRD